MKALDARVILKRPEFEVDVALEMDHPGILSLFGPSGSGKTTVLRVLAGLERSARGHVRVNNQTWQDDGVRRPPHRRHVGMVFQDARLFPHLNAGENLGSGARLRYGTIDPGLFVDICSLLDLESILPRSVAELSGGERQRVAIGRCLLTRPDLLLLDEPLSALEAERRDEILPYLIRLHRQLSIPIVHVSHDWSEVLRLADQVAMIERGRIVRTGPTRSLNAQVAGQQARHLNLLDARVRGYHTPDELLTLDLGSLELHIPGRSLRPGTRVRILIDESEVAISRHVAADTSVLNVLPAMVDETVESGPGSVRVRLTIQGQSICAAITRRSARLLSLTAGEAVYLMIKSAAVQWVAGGSDDKSGAIT